VGPVDPVEPVFPVEPVGPVFPVAPVAPVLPETDPKSAFFHLLPSYVNTCPVLTVPS
jgi:hypothetical protein